MKDTEVLLKEHVKNLGKCGDIVRVAPGYARNFLIPRGIAIGATDDNKKAMSRRREKLDAEEAILFAEIDKRLNAIAALSLETIERADTNGHLYGSVTANTIVSLLASAGHEVDEKDVRLEKHIKEVGTYQVPIHLHADRSTEVTVEVKSEGEVKAEGAEEKAEEKPEEQAEEPAEAPEAPAES